MNQTSLFTGAEAPPAPHFDPVWIKARVRGKALKVGRVYVMSKLSAGVLPSADADTVGLILSHQMVFYREQTTWFDFYSYKDKSIGCDRAAWNKALELGTQFMVTYAKKERRLCIVHKSNVTYDLDLGRGIQARAKLKHCHVFDGIEALPASVTKKSIIVESL
jgi:hypothetical protein